MRKKMKFKIQILFYTVNTSTRTMADNEANRQAEAEPAAIPQDRPENNQGRIAYEAVIRRIMDTRECSYEVARRIFGQMGFTAAHGAREPLGRIPILNDRQICRMPGCRNLQYANLLCRMCNTAERGRRG